jgi:hypothetical protein
MAFRQWLSGSGVIYKLETAHRLRGLESQWVCSPLSERDFCFSETVFLATLSFLCLSVLWAAGFFGECFLGILTAHPSALSSFSSCAPWKSAFCCGDPRKHSHSRSKYQRDLWVEQDLCTDILRILKLPCGSGASSDTSKRIPIVFLSLSLLLTIHVATEEELDTLPH